MNRQTYRLYIGMLAAGLALAGCRQEEVTELPEGRLLLSLTDKQVELTRATPAELGKPAAASFQVKVVKADGQVIYNDLFTEQPIPAAEGRYTVTASCGENKTLAWDEPYYEGTAQAEVSKGKNARVTVPCRVANALLSVEFANPAVFNELYRTYAVQVQVGGQSLNISAASTGQSAYFRANADLKVEFQATLKEDGKEVAVDLNESLKGYLPLAAGSHARIRLTASNTVLQVEKVEVTQATIEETIPPSWLPRPQVNGFGQESHTLQTVETNGATTAVIGFKAASPIQEAEFTLNVEDEHLKPLNGTYTVSALTPEQRSLLEENGIAVPALQTKEGALDLTGLTAVLQTNNGTTTRNRASLRIRANDRWSDEVTEAAVYTIETVKPEFAVSVEPGNVWSREFTINEITVTSGQLAALQKQLTYQYYDGKEWRACLDRNQRPGRTQQFAAAAEEIAQKTYRVRALYRGAIASAEAEVTLEEPVQLPNGDMNQWTYEVYGRKFYTFMPYNDPAAKAWDTNNVFTTRHRHNTVGMDYYNGFHAVSYVPGKGGTGYAAELRSTANGRGNTVFIGHTELDINKVAGELFTGTGKLHLEGNDINGKDRFERIKDTKHPSRPTGLRFFYQYLPYTTDTWSVCIELLDGSKNVIASRNFQAGDERTEWTEATVPLDFLPEKGLEKCAYIYVLFSSTTQAGANMPYRKIEQTYYVDNTTKTHKTAYVGSVLRIDDISLIYDK